MGDDEDITANIDSINNTENNSLKNIHGIKDISKNTDTRDTPENISENPLPKKTSIKKTTKKTISALFLIILFLILSLFFTRLVNPREIDDVSPGIPCEDEYLQKSDVLWVIPEFEGRPISENKTWCAYILGLNKTLGMHGVTHEFNEFETDRTKEYLENGTKIFEECFGFQPDRFKPPQLKISENNKELIKNSGLKLMLNWNQLIKKVYHCDDSKEQFSNKVMDWF